MKPGDTIKWLSSTGTVTSGEVVKDYGGVVEVIPAYWAASPKPPHQGVPAIAIVGWAAKKPAGL